MRIFPYRVDHFIINIYRVTEKKHDTNFTLYIITVCGSHFENMGYFHEHTFWISETGGQELIRRLISKGSMMHILKVRIRYENEKYTDLLASVESDNNYKFNTFAEVIFNSQP